MAALRGHTAVIAALQDAGADADTVQHDGSSPLIDVAGHVTHMTHVTYIM